MYTSLDGPIEASTSRRRASTANSTGLDYPSSYQVDEDILSRIRSLLLARNDHHPPQTPHTSDEHPSRFARDHNPHKFDFSTAKSVAKLARVASAKLTLPKGSRSLSKSADMANDRRPTEPELPFAEFRPPLRTSSSVNDLRAPFDDAIVRNPELPCCLKCGPEDPNKKPWLPKLVLQDTRKPNKSIKSCIEISTQIPPNDVEIHENELDCCPPCDPAEKNQSKYTEKRTARAGRQLRAEPADLACFLAGCPPGRLNCQTHQRQPGKTYRGSMQERRIGDDFKAIAGGLAKDVAKISQSITGSIAANSPLALTEIPQDDPQRPYSPLRMKSADEIPPITTRKFGEEFSKDNKISIGKDVLITTSKSSPRSSVTSTDKFPHAFQSLEAAAKEALMRPFSTTISTNFSLPGPKAKPAQGNDPRDAIVPRKLSNALPGPTVNSTPWKDISDTQFEQSFPKELPGPQSEASHALPPQKSNGSLRIKPPKSPSLLSGASKTSAYRHSLLKPSISESQPVDTGLPVPPVLTPATGMSEIAMPPERKVEKAKDEFSDKPHNETQADVQPAPPAPVVGYLTNLQKAKDFVDSVKERIQEVSQDLESPNSSNSSPKRVVRIEVRDRSGVEDAAPRSSTAKGSEIDSIPPIRKSSRLHSFRQKETQLYESIKERTREAKERFQPSKCNDGGNSTLDNQSSGPDGIQLDPQKALPTSPIRQKRESVPFSSPSSTHVSRAPTESSTVTYWGFVPTVKDSVQDAVQIAVRKAVNEISIPPGAKPAKAARAYRRLVADSLTEAAKEADDYLRRASVWKESEATVITPEKSSKICLSNTELTESQTADSKRKPQTQDSQSPSGAHQQLADPKTPSRVNTKPSQEASVFRRQANSSQVCPDPSKHSFRMTSNSQDVTGNIMGVSNKLGSQENLGTPLQPSQADSVPLETVDETLSENHRQGWKIPSPFRKGSSTGYVAIPTRQSSRNRVLSPKTHGTNSPSQLPPKESISPSRKRSFEDLLSRATHGLRSVFSAGSLRSSVSEKRDKPEQSLLENKQCDESNDLDSLSNLPSSERLGRKNTVHWLRDLLSSNGPYEPRLTALPPRTRRNQDSSTGRLRSQTAPTIPVNQLFLGAAPNVVDVDGGVQKSLQIVQGDEKALVSATFTKTINDLENLLNEALVIARLAAERDGRARRHDSRQSDEISIVGSIHESMRSYSGSSDSAEDSDGDRYSVRNDQDKAYERIRTTGITIAKQPTMGTHRSGWPPTGRVSTPYPPNTQPPSQDSIIVEISQSEQNDVVDKEPELTRDVDLRSKSAEFNANLGSTTVNKDTELIAHADPRSKPTEVNANLGSIAEISLASSPKPDDTTRNTRLSTTLPVEFKNIEPFKAEISSMNRSRGQPNSPGRLSPKRKSIETRKSLGVRKSQEIPPDPVVVGSIPPVPLPKPTPRGVSQACDKEHSEEDHQAIRTRLAANSVPNKRKVRHYIMEFRSPPIQPRASSKALRKQAEQPQTQTQSQTRSGSKALVKGQTFAWQDIDRERIEPCSRLMSEAAASSKDLRSEELKKLSNQYSHSLDGSQVTHSEEIDFNHGYGHRQHTVEPATETTIIREREIVELRDVPNRNLPVTSISGRKRHHMFSLKGQRHVSLRDHKGFSLARSKKRQPIARDWSPGRKRFCAAVACISTALVGILVGIYAGETPAIQYWIVDFHHYTVLGNVFFFIGLSIPTFLFWPLPLLHGRKPYILGAMSLAMPLLFPQAVAVGDFRSPYVATWRVALIFPRALMGFCLGFANMNFKGILTDLFGASLQSENPHQEHVDPFDVRRHGGGMGVWLGLWTWSAMGSIGVGFLIGALIINTLSPAWGFYISITIIAFVLLLNVLTPEVRRSAFRRSVAEVKDGEQVSRRLARGEVKMHMVQTGPKWWGEEFHYGLMLSIKMLRQPGFMVMAVYVAWMYGQIVLIVLLLGSLCSNSYKFKSPEVGAAVAAVPLGALVAIPFQKASIFSRDRNHAPISDDDTYKKKVKWSSHLVRRAIFVLSLPFAGLAYTLSSSGPPIPFILPILFAALIGFLSNLAMAECHGIIMETYDTSDLQPGMTGRARGSAGDKSASKRTNYSSFPRVASAFAITQGLGYLIAAVASGVGGALTRNLGQQAATGIMAFILLVLSLGLLGVLIRFKDVQIIPDSKKDEMDQYHNARRTSTARRAEGIDEEEPWRPIIIGNPHHSTRRMCILELGSMSRFSEIRRKNLLVDEQSLEARHPNQQMMVDIKLKIKEKELQVVHHVRRSLSRGSSRGSRRSKYSDDGRARNPEQGDLGGHREMGNMHSGNGSQRRRATNIRE